MFDALDLPELFALAVRLNRAANRCVSLANAICDCSEGADLGDSWLYAARELRELRNDLDAARAATA